MYHGIGPCIRLHEYSSDGKPSWSYWYSEAECCHSHYDMQVGKRFYGHQASCNCRIETDTFVSDTMSQEHLGQSIYWGLVLPLGLMLLLENEHTL